ncbi:hypothetical protein GCM10022286_12660 [Gryllotalpicola daejeonensis]|uniref:YcxB family protein n=1 Tax=Gryllotalpicola daejeonensis TaxID=993087 RepID=A0ABP7ZIA7_9MICO
MTDATVALHYEFTADENTARGAATSLLRVQIFRPFVIVVLAILELAALFPLIGSILAEDGFGIAVGAFMFCIPIFVVLLTRVLLLRATKKLFPSGARYAMGFTPGTARIVTPLGDSTVLFAAFRTLRRVGDFVVARQVTGAFVILPGQLIPNDWFEYISSRLQGGPWRSAFTR